jgi:hypothetical protein
MSFSTINLLMLGLTVDNHVFVIGQYKFNELAFPENVLNTGLAL